MWFILNLYTDILFSVLAWKFHKKNSKCYFLKKETACSTGWILPTQIFHVLLFSTLLKTTLPWVYFSLEVMESQTILWKKKRVKAGKKSPPCFLQVLLLKSVFHIGNVAGLLNSQAEFAKLESFCLKTSFAYLLPNSP